MCQNVPKCANSKIKKTLKWMTQNGSKLHKMAQNDTKLLKNCSKWPKKPLNGCF
jgi:hypothetical protein